MRLKPSLLCWLTEFWSLFAMPRADIARSRFFVSSRAVLVASLYVTSAFLVW